MNQYTHGNGPGDLQGVSQWQGVPGGQKGGSGTSSLKWLIPVVCIAACMIAGVILILMSAAELGADKQPPTQCKESERQKTQGLLSQAPELSADHTPKSTLLMGNCGVVGTIGSDQGMDPNYDLFGNGDRRDVCEIVFLDTLADAPEDAWDVSQAQDGGVLAWLESDPDADGSTLCIAAERGVEAPQDCTGLFAYYENLRRVDFNGCFRTESVRSMQYLFYRCGKLYEVDFDGVDTAQVSSMHRMFTSCSDLFSVDVSGFDTGNVVDMYAMFRGCEALEAVDLSGWNLERVKNLSRMFEGCNALVSVKTGELNTVQAEDMSYLFYQCYALTDLDVSGLNTGQVRDMYAMFSNCTSLTHIDVTGFDTSNVTDMQYMFTKCTSVTGLDVSGFDISKVEKMHHIFYQCGGVTGYEGWDVSHVSDADRMFE